MKNPAGPLLALAALATAGTAAAQEPTDGAASAPIVVEGQRNRDAQIRELIEALPPTRSDGHYSRFEEGACPALLGVPPHQRALAAERIRAVAAAGGVPVAGAKCLTNVLVIVTPDKKRLIAQLAKQYPSYFSELSKREISSLLKGSGPSALWHRKELYRSDGRARFAAGSVDYLDRRSTEGASRLRDLAHPAFTGSILIVESAALDGLTTTQLADYAAMRAFTGADPERLPGGKVSTILTVLETPMGAEVPNSLTAWDIAFLKSLYKSSPNSFAPGQRGQIRARMKKEMDAASGGAAG
jgi:hypothetical protein